MRIIGANFTGLVALVAISAQGAPSTRNENWRPLGTALSFRLGDQACGEGLHQALWRDWPSSVSATASCSNWVPRLGTRSLAATPG
jgi:hypothetical protein